MKIVIEVPEEEYNTRQLVHYFGCYSDKLDLVIYNGKPLPKGHGRLIDGDKAIADFANYGIDHMWDATDLPYIIDESPIIIEADKEE